MIKKGLNEVPELNKDRIFNESPKKVLIREFTNLKNDYTKLNALKYKSFYENESLSFILENSRYIFSEPIKGYEFYKNVITESILPFGKLDDEVIKVDQYVQENVQHMSDTQKNMYTSLLSEMKEKCESMKYSTSLYDMMMENSDSMMEIYDEIYEDAQSFGIDDIIDPFEGIMEFSDSINIMDAINIGIRVPEVSSSLVSYLESAYVENPESAEDYALNTFSSNVVNRMLRDKYFSEAVNACQNINLRHLIKGMGSVSDSSRIDDIVTEVSHDNDVIYASPVSSVNRIYESNTYSEVYEEYNDEEKANRLLCEKAVVDINKAFAIMDFMISDDDKAWSNSIVESVCIESDEIEKIPQTTFEHISMLEKVSDDLQSEIVSICEKYFTVDGGPSKVISQAIGVQGSDENQVKKKEKEEPYIPYKKPEEPETVNIPDTEEPEKSDEPNDDDENAKRIADKKRKTDKYAKMDIEELDSLSEASDEDDSRIMPPPKRNIFQRIQNKALDMNVKFKRKVANARRKSVDARNAGKASAKIPMNVTNSIKKTVGEWDEMDDNRRKEYIIKPGFRKKYFRALKLCIMHYGAFAINPVLNIVLAISQKASHTKDVRIRNELIRELNAEIKVTEEKIEDAKSNGDNQQKYKLMRIKEKLQAEVTRVQANTKFI